MLLADAISGDDGVMVVVPSDGFIADATLLFVVLVSMSLFEVIVSVVATTVLVSSDVVVSVMVDDV